MPSVTDIRRRIKSVENTAKITKAMSMIAASKMRRAQEMALESRPYSQRLRSLLSNLAAQNTDEEYTHPLLTKRPVKNTTVVLLTPNRGLTGGLHSKINRTAGQFLVNQTGEKQLITIGRKGRDFMIRTGQNVKAEFTAIDDKPSISDIRDDYINGLTDAVHIVYADFVSTTLQKPIIQSLLPITPADLNSQDAVGYIYEPSNQEVLASLLPRFVELELYHAVLESMASEHSARMVAMRNATDNADEMVIDLTLEMNKARQETITRELLDIIGGAAAVGN
jgi:F-type H+-transporting ATPase subunit gamma